MATSNGCNLDVQPPGITAMFVFFSTNRFLTEFTIWPQKESNISIERRLPKWFFEVQTFSTHHNISCSLTHTFSLALM
jgi:hypothetical protein